ncbi:hypothetical protein ID866_3634 [Astraeus odoratus]|nr:hypothetical protein ID866_3634 [Astraeus odoratus]
MSSNSESVGVLGVNVAPHLSDDTVKRRKMSTRAAKRKRVQDPELEQEVVSQNEPRAPKKVRRGPVVGRLAGLMELPLDILFEIFGHLNPLDVLRLARTTKQFRRVLMHRSALSIWIAARQNVPNLPDCPPYMMDFRLGRRICTKCAKECMLEDYHVFSGESVYKAVPSKYGNPQEREAFVKERRALVFDMEKACLLQEFCTILSCLLISMVWRARRLETVVEELTKLGWGPEIEKIPPRDDLSLHKLVKQPTRLTPRIWSNIRPGMIKYMEQMKSQRLERERKALVISRKQIAVSILRAYKINHLPLTEVMPEPVDFFAFPEVDTIIERPTEEEVTGSSFAGVVARMDELITQWRSRCHDTLLEQFKDALSEKVQQRIGHVAKDGSVDASMSSPADPKGKGKAKAVDVPPPDDAQLMDALSLATTVFRCVSCGPRLNPWFDIDDPWEDEYAWLSGLPSRNSASSTPLFYPKVMGHRCLTKHRQYIPIQDADPTKQLNSSLNTRTKWTCTSLQIDKVAQAIVSAVVSACGQDPLTTTAAHMDAMDPKLACLSCARWDDGIWDQCDASVFDWRAAVVHCVHKHRSRSDVKWKFIDEQLIDEIENVDNKTLDQVFLATFVSAFLGTSLHSDVPEDAVWLCTHCVDLPAEREYMELSRVKSHLTLAHSVEEPQINRDYYQAYEAPQGCRLHMPDLKIVLNMERPSDVPSPGEEMPDYDYFSDECLCEACDPFIVSDFGSTLCFTHLPQLLL